MTQKNSQLLIGILRNQDPESAKDWIEACKNHEVNYQVINIASRNWLKDIIAEEYDFFLIQPEGRYERLKILYDERLLIISNILGYKIFPSFNESIIYENKKMLSYYLRANKIPHPTTDVLYDYEDAVNYTNRAKYPFVAKTSIGAAGSGVKIIRNRSESLAYLKKAFKGKGIHRRFGPNRVTGNPRKWFVKALNSPSYFKKRLGLYFEIHKNVQTGYVIFQEYVPHDFEWRIVKIGESYFAHKKIKVNDKASGGKQKQFGLPDYDALNFVESICNKNRFNSVCIDLFEAETSYLVNEIQCIFGIPYGYLSKLDDKVGRFVKKENQWVFEAGEFTKNNCCDLKLETAIDLYYKKLL